LKLLLRKAFRTLCMRSAILDDFNVAGDINVYFCPKKKGLRSETNLRLFVTIHNLVWGRVGGVLGEGVEQIHKNIAGKTRFVGGATRR
ncbi:MAG TPA: hypothetical protein V6D29_22955, partial [Leptolyngbyaceae cyanobacterium]